MLRDTIIVVPCFCCERQIPRVLSRLIEQLPSAIAEVVVIDNASTDSTVEAVLPFIRPEPVPIRLFRNRRNFSLGGSFRIASRYAYSKGYRRMIFLHGDDQADAGETSLLIEESDRYPDVDAVLGARFMPDSHRVGYSWIRHWGNKFLNLVFSAALRQRIYDLGSGLTLYHLSRIDQEEFESLSDHIAFDAELLMRLASRSGVRFVPISWREEDQRSNAGNVSTGFLLLKILFLRWRRTVKRQTHIHYEYELLE